MNDTILNNGCLYVIFNDTVNGSSEKIRVITSLIMTLSYYTIDDKILHCKIAIEFKV
jgi:hypothetical protein